MVVVFTEAATLILPYLKVPKRFVGLIEMQCSFDNNWGKQNDTTVFWQQLHPRYCVLQHARRCMGRVTKSLIAWVVRVTGPFQPPSTGGHPLENSIKLGRKTIKCFVIFVGFITKTDYICLEYFLMLGMHSQR